MYVKAAIKAAFIFLKKPKALIFFGGILQILISEKAHTLFLLFLKKSKSHTV